MIINPVIMVVDDDAMVRAIIHEYLESFGYKNVIVMPDGEAALKYLRVGSNHVDLIISDWEMPKLNGLGLLQAVRHNQSRKDVKFLMLTSQRSQERFKITKAVRHHVDAYMVKPFQGEVFKLKVEQLLAEEKQESA